jgi:L,D-peptidoglycan transpeptidase YkuD (ErfK/YbiS/YcfS/YnhG family)
MARHEADRELLPFSLRRARSRRRGHRGWLVAPFLVIVLGALGAYPILSGRTREPIEARQLALASLENARAADAGRWVPEVMARLEDAYRATVYEERRQAGRIVFFRNFGPTAESYRTVHTLARETVQAAEDRFGQLVADAQGALEKAERMLSGANRAADRMPFPHGARMMLQTARIHLDEARLLLEAREPEECAQRASVAMGEAQAACRGALPLAARFADAEQVRTWRRQVDETVAWSRSTGGTALVVYKEKNLLHLYRGGSLVRSYAADMGSNSIAPKRHGGDRATPEGRYRIVSKKGRGQSRYYKALLLNYPNEEDRRRFEQAKRRGEVTRGSGLGGLIEIHGEGGRGDDWTLGCVALSNRDMDEVFSRVEVGTPVTIVGGDGRGGNFSDLMPMLSDPDGEEGP